MKKILLFAMMAMVACAASAQTLSWTGNSAVYNADNDTWYNAGATWAATSITVTDFSLVSTLTLGGEVQTYISPDGSHNSGLTVNMGYGVDGTYWDSVPLTFLEQTGNNDKYQNITGVDIVAASQSTVGYGEHTLQVYFSASDGTTTVYDNKGGSNYAGATYTTAIPEPATMSLLGLGALAMVLRRKIRK